MTAPDREYLPVLIVDDDEDAHFFLRRELHRAGVCEAASVYGGGEATDHLSRCLQGLGPLPALLFLDVMMPGMDGFQVLDWLHMKRLLSRLTVAMLTSSENPADVARAIARGAHVYLTKPARAEQLRPVLNAAARRSSNVPLPAAR